MHKVERSGQTLPKLVVETSKTLPIADLQVIFNCGSTADVQGQEGLTWATARMLRMGTKHLKHMQVEERLARLGAELSIEVAPSFVRFAVTTLARNARAVIDLFCALITEPAFRREDLARLKREALTALVQRRDADSSLAQIHFRQWLFGDHPYGRPVTPRSIKHWSAGLIRSLYKTRFHQGNLIVGVAGDLSEGDAGYFYNALTQHLPNAPSDGADVVGDAQEQAGFRLRLVDKPERSQTQILMGTLGLRAKDENYLPMMLANTVFGGTFSSRLTQAVRVERGWSYNALSTLGFDRHRDSWSMWSFPASPDTKACVELKRGLFEHWIIQGISDAELEFARQSAIRSFAFERDTAVKRLSLSCEELIFDLPPGYYRNYTSTLNQAGLSEINHTLKEVFNPENLSAVVVGTRDLLENELTTIPSLTAFETVDYTSI